jgi:hypothetical protein
MNTRFLIFCMIFKLDSFSISNMINLLYYRMPGNPRCGLDSSGSISVIRCKEGMGHIQLVL